MQLPNSHVNEWLKGEPQYAIEDNSEPSGYI